MGGCCGKGRRRNLDYRPTAESLAPPPPPPIQTEQTERTQQLTPEEEEEEYRRTHLRMSRAKITPNADNDYMWFKEVKSMDVGGGAGAVPGTPTAATPPTPQLRSPANANYLPIRGTFPINSAALGIATEPSLKPKLRGPKSKRSEKSESSLTSTNETTNTSNRDTTRTSNRDTTNTSTRETDTASPATKPTLPPSNRTIPTLPSTVQFPSTNPNPKPSLPPTTPSPKTFSGSTLNSSKK